MRKEMISLAEKLTKEEKAMLGKAFQYSLGTNMASSKVSMQSKCFAMAMSPGLELFYMQRGMKISVNPSRP